MNNTVAIVPPSSPVSGMIDRAMDAAHPSDNDWDVSLAAQGFRHDALPTQRPPARRWVRRHHQPHIDWQTAVTDAKIGAQLALRGKGHGAVGRDRIAMLQAVADKGSITQAAKALGFSYKTVWDGINAINNLMPRPALIAQAGGKGGGGAVLTEDGRRLIDAFRRLEDKLSRVSRVIAEDGLDEHFDLLFWSVAMKTSARNAFRCKVIEVKRAAVDVEVVLKLSESNVIVAVVTNESADELAIVPGRDTMALVKASFIMLARAEEMPRVSTANQITGIVIERIDGGVNSEIILDVGNGRTLTSVVTKHSVDAMRIEIGTKVCAFFLASQVILAAD
jgi:molybdate transport system regulatory protein